MLLDYFIIFWLYFNFEWLSGMDVNAAALQLWKSALILSPGVVCMESFS